MKRRSTGDGTRAPTLADVGRAAGVSQMAASLVLSGAGAGSRVSPATRDRIIEAAKALRYRPNIAARALTKGRINTLGIAAVFPDGKPDSAFLEIFSGLLAAAARFEQNTTIFNLRDWRDGLARLGGFFDGRIDSLILITPTLAGGELPAVPPRMPLITIQADQPLPGAVNIESDEEEGAHALTRHLIAQGHQRIVHLAGHPGLPASERRLRGWKRALIDAGIPFDPGLLVPAGVTADLGRAVMRRWLAQHAGEPLPQAAFCAHQSAAVGCFEALTEAGVRVPDDVSLAGFDDHLPLRPDEPPMTTVRPSLHEMGVRAVELLMNRIPPATTGRAADQIFVPMQLVPSPSVGAPPAVARLASTPWDIDAADAVAGVALPLVPAE